MLTTRRRFASARRFFASSSPSSILCASLISSSAERSGTLPISFKYMRTGSSMLTPSGTERSMFSISISSSSERSMSSSSRTRRSRSAAFGSSVMSERRSTSMPLASRYSNTFSICSASSGISRKKSLISWYSRTLFFFLPYATSSFNFSINFALSKSIDCPSFHSLYIFCPCPAKLNTQNRRFQGFSLVSRPP